MNPGVVLMLAIGSQCINQHRSSGDIERVVLRHPTRLPVWDMLRRHEFDGVDSFDITPTHEVTFGQK